MEGLIRTTSFFTPPESLVMKYQIHVWNVKIALGSLRQHIMSVVIIVKKELCNSIYPFFFVFFCVLFFCLFFFFEYVFSVYY